MKPHLNFSLDPIEKVFDEILYIEEWMPVEGYDEWYSVSSFGRFLSHRENRIMKQYKNEKGYLTIGFQSNKKRKKFKSHRVVAIAFIPNPDNKPEINHDDFNKENNFFKNLEWSTQKENTNHAQRGGRRPMAKPPKPKVGEYPLRLQKVIDNNTGRVYESVYHLSKEIGVKPKEIRRKLSGERQNNTSYTWLKGTYSLFYPKREQALMERFKILRPLIFGCTA